MLDFQDSTLLISLRSPFARRVRLALRETGIRHSEQIVDVWKPTEEITARNPLARVPTVVLKSGRILIDSNLILDQLYLAHPHSLAPRDTELRLQMLEAGVLATGMMEKTIEYFFQILRPEAHRDQELMKEAHDVIPRVLTSIENTLESRETYLSCGLTQADLDVGTALRYLVLRYSADWRGKYPRASRYLERLEDRKAFRETMPPEG
jgi:glutathione S-transferase